MKRLGGSIAGAAGTIAVLTLASRLVGFVRVWVQNGALGDTQSGVAFSTSNTVPNILFEVAAGGALAGAVIPLISGFLATKHREELERTAGALLTWVLAIGLGVAAIVVLAARPLTALLLGAHAPGGEVELAARLLRIFALQIPLYGMSVVLTGVLQAHKRFVMPALAPMLSSLGAMATFLAFHLLSGGHENDPALLSNSAVLALGWGTTASVMLFSLPQLIPASRLVSLRPTFRFPAGVARRALKLAGAGLGGLLAQQIQIVAIMLAANTRGGTGAYPVYTFANAVYMVPYAVLAVPIATAVFPRLSEAAALEGRPGLGVLTARSTRLVMDIGFLCVALLAVLARPARIVFDVLRPAEHMDIAMMAMAPGLVGYALIYHCSRVLYAVEASRAVAVVNSIAWLSVCVVLGIEIALGASGRRDVLIAIGIAISVGMTIGVIGELIAIRRAVGPQATYGMLRSALIMGVCALVAGALALAAVNAILSLSPSLGGALLAILAGGVLICGIGGATMWWADRDAVRLATA